MFVGFYYGIFVCKQASNSLCGRSVTGASVFVCHASCFDGSSRIAGCLI
jgi:hypothetical protein